MKDNIKVSLVDDHKLLRKGMIELIEGFKGYTVLSEASNGKSFIGSLSADRLPDILLLDINMPEMNGYETACYMKENFPSVRILALSMYDDDHSIIKMIRAGARGYILKDAEPEELAKAFDDIIKKGFYYSDLVSSKLVASITSPTDKASFQLTDRELTFIELACSELTYKEIADKMLLAPRTIDGYRESLFEKLNVKSRVGLVLFAAKNGIIKL